MIVHEASALRREIYSYLFSGKGYEKAKADLNQARTKPWYNETKSQQDDLFAPLHKPSELTEQDNPNIIRFAREMHYDPVPALQALRVPALFLFGDQDQLIPVEKSVEVIRRVLTQSGHRDFTIRVFPNLDHGMHLTTNGVEGTIDPEYLATMRPGCRRTFASRLKLRRAGSRANTLWAKPLYRLRRLIGIGAAVAR
jgi:pimeloyl-ACP methyl ester carboxylesterase